jgi:NAD(P)-dependent dehydrogenase (short-subunit alcohol dehydrogenase family)
MDETVIVTGAAKGIGRAVAERLAATARRIVAVDRNEALLDATVAGLPGSGHIALAADLADLTTHSAIADAGRATGRLIGLAHCAGVLRRVDSVFDVTEDDWDVQFATNAKATFFLAREVASTLVTQGQGGSIVTFTSQAWWTGGIGGAVVYAGTKGAVTSLTRGLATALAPHNIRVNTVAPGFVETDMMLGGLSDAQRQAFVDRVPLGRMARPDEIAGTVEFLLSPAAAYMTGATLNLTGGQLPY